MRTLLLFSLVVLLSSCKEIAGPQGPSGPAGSPLTGNISGRVLLLRDSILPTLLPSHEGVLINSPSNASYTAYSDSAGSWTLSTVAAGMHTVVFSKPGFLQVPLYAQQFVGGGTLYLPTIYLVEVPQNNVAQLIASAINTTTAIRVTGRMQVPELGRGAIIMLSAAPPLSPHRLDYFALVTGSAHSDTAGHFSGYVDMNDMFRSLYRLRQGMQVYVTAFPTPEYYDYWNSLQRDPSTNLFHFESAELTLSALDTIVVP